MTQLFPVETKNQQYSTFFNHKPANICSKKSTAYQLQSLLNIPSIVSLETFQKMVRSLLNNLQIIIFVSTL